MRGFGAFAIVVILSACGGGSAPAARRATGAQVDSEAGPGTAAAAGTEAGAETATAASATGAAAPGPQPTSSPGDSPEISHSAGKPGSVVVLWTRIIPRSEDAAILKLAAELQIRMRSVVLQTVPGRDIDLRPAPERVCPQAGCQGASASVLLLHNNGGCAAVAMFSPSGRSPVQLVPWLGEVNLKSGTAPFRSPPESLVQVTDYVPCAKAIDALVTADKSVAEMLRTVVAQSN